MGYPRPSSDVSARALWAELELGFRFLEATRTCDWPEYRNRFWDDAYGYYKTVRHYIDKAKIESSQRERLRDSLMDLKLALDNVPHDKPAERTRMFLKRLPIANRFFS